ncbi:MAG: CRTAC1 family protein [Planctomycetota bacterium]|nr:MAG: CRTAC1 family protein [Planctomycetota bacterium]
MGVAQPIAAWKRVLASATFVGLLGYVWSQRDHALAVESSADTLPGSSAAGIAFEEVSASAGLVFQHTAPRLDEKLAHLMPEVASVGAAVSVTDADGDGWVDVYATNSAIGSDNALFRNLRDGRFENVARAAGIADVNRAGDGASMGSVWADLDGDGDEDAYVYKWGYAQLFRNELAGGDGALRFSDATAASGLRRWINANTACWLDYDRDGFLDLFTAGYFADDVNLYELETTRIRQNSFEFATNGGKKRLFRNDGELRFEEKTELLGPTVTRWTLGSAAADFDADGWIDLYVANDYGPEEFFANDGGKRFHEQLDAGLKESSKSGMCVAVGDFQNDGALDTYVTNISKHGYLFQGNNLRRNDLARNGKFENLGDVQGGQLADCGWAWGAQFGDFDRDGWTDLFVANGFISASRERDYWYQMGKVAMGSGDIFQDARAWPPIEDRSLSGYECSSVLRNLRGQSWLDVAAKAGVTDLYDGRGVAVADLWNRGALDVLVANQVGPLLAYKNVGENANGWTGVRLAGRAPNTSAIGAHVTLRFGKRVQRKVVDGGSGFSSQNDRRVYFGVGTEPGALSIDVVWPSGVAQSGLSIERGQWNEVREP